MTEYKTNKLEVTEEIIATAIEAFNTRGSAFSAYLCMKAALEAVFAMLPNITSEDEQYYLDEISKRDKEIVGLEWEIKKKESADNAQSKDDRWFYHHENQMPAWLKPDDEIEVILADKSTQESQSAEDWFWRKSGDAGEIIAYRIVDKPELEKEIKINRIEIKSSPDKPQFQMQETEEIVGNNTLSDLKGKSEKEKKPTFKEFFDNKFNAKGVTMCLPDVDSLSEYLETYMQCKE